ncbi:MAG: TetR/AcrR family transcriptional regulator [Gaiellaceae bacterium]
MAEGSRIQAERRRQILQAAVRTFADKGHQAARVSDIAKEAGVAYGLVYHYYESEEIELAQQALQRIVENGQENGEFRADVDARLTATIWYGALEEILTGWAFGQLPDRDDDVARAERAVVEIVTGGLASDRTAAPA